jgi:hypothetical protein
MKMIGFKATGVTAEIIWRRSNKDDGYEWLFESDLDIYSYVE